MNKHTVTSLLIIGFAFIWLFVAGCGEITTESLGSGGDNTMLDAGGVGGAQMNGVGGMEIVNRGAGGNGGTGGVIVQNGTGGNQDPVAGTLNITTWAKYAAGVGDFTNRSLQGVMHICVYNNDLYGAIHRNSVCAWKYGVDINADRIPSDQIVARWDSSSIVDLSGYSAGEINPSNPYKLSFTMSLPLDRNYLVVVAQGGNDNPQNFCGRLPFDTSQQTPFLAAQVAFTQSGGTITVNKAMTGLNPLTIGDAFPNFTTDCDHAVCSNVCGCPGPDMDPGCTPSGGQ